MKQLESESTAPAHSESTVTDLQRQIDALTLDSLREMPKAMPGAWCGDGPPNIEAIPPMPTSDLQELGMFFSNRNCKLRNALEFGDISTIARSAIWWAGHHSTHVIHVSGANGRHNEVNNDGSFDRFSGCEATMFARGFQSCVSIFGREPSLNDARCGLRGVRVGEASNPGPRSRVRPRREEVAEDLLSSLEFELTMLDSSDVNLLWHPVEGRHVIPREGCRVPSTPIHQYFQIFVPQWSSQGARYLGQMSLRPAIFVT